MPLSENLKQFHREICPDIPIDSIEFTYKLIEVISKLKKDMSSICPSRNAGVEKSPQDGRG